MIQETTGENRRHNINGTEGGINLSVDLREHDHCPNNPSLHPAPSEKLLLGDW